MNNIKVGKYISEMRKANKLTQAELAKKLHVTDRAVSKWERGKGYPDITILPKISEVLGVNINEILLGENIETITKENADEITKRGIKIYSRKTKNKIVIIFICTIFFIVGLVSIYKILEYQTIYKYLDFENLEVLGKDIKVDNNAYGYIIRVESLKLEKSNECSIPYRYETKDSLKMEIYGRISSSENFGIDIFNKRAFINITLTVNDIGILGERTKNTLILVASETPIEFDDECLHAREK